MEGISGAVNMVARNTLLLKELGKLMQALFTNPTEGSLPVNLYGPLYYVKDNSDSWENPGTYRGHCGDKRLLQDLV